MSTNEFDMFKGIDDVVDFDSVYTERAKMSEFVGEVVIITGYTMKNGQFGEYAIVTCLDNESGDEYPMSTGSSAVLAQLGALTKKDYPIQARIAKHGEKGYRLTNP